MIFKLILLFGALLALALTIRTNSRLTNILVAGMICSIILVQFPHPDLVLTGIILFMIMTAGVFAAGITIKGKDPAARLIICLMSASQFTYWLWMLNHWHGNTALAPILTLIAGMAAIMLRKRLRAEWGALLILLIDAADSLLEIILRSLQ